MEFEYDISSCEAAILTLSSMLNIDTLEIKNCCAVNDDIIDNWENIFEISDVFFKEISFVGSCAIGQHITTSNENCHSIKKYGLINTQETLKNNTVIKQFLENEIGLIFDIDKKSFKYKGINYDIDYYKLRNSINEDGKPPVYSLSRKIYAETHYPVNFFFYNNDLKSYSCIYKMPEVFSDILKFILLIDSNKLEKTNIFEKWIEEAIPYLITFRVDFREINIEDLIDSHYDEITVKKELISNAFNVVLDNRDRISASLKNFAKIEIDNIINIKQI